MTDQFCISWFDGLAISSKSWYILAVIVDSCLYDADDRFFVNNYVKPRGGISVPHWLIFKRSLSRQTEWGVCVTINDFPLTSIRFILSADGITLFRCTFCLQSMQILSINFLNLDTIEFYLLRFSFWMCRKLLTMTMVVHHIQLGETMMISMSSFGMLLCSCFSIAVRSV